MRGRMGNYDIVTETRALEILRVEVELLRRGGGGNKLEKPLPAPFGQIKQGSTGAIIGKEIITSGSLAKSVAARIEKSQNTWRIANGRLLRNKVIIPRIKIMLRDSLIRRTMIDGLRTKELPRNLLNQLETYMYKHIRATMNPRWKDEAWYPEKKQLYKKIRQSAMESWLNRTQVMTMLTQTRGNKTIHPQQ